MTDPVRGMKGMDEAIAAGRDPNADLDDTRDPRSRAEAAVTLKMGGASNHEIAQTLGYSSARHARTAVERALAAAGTNPESRDYLREIMRRRMDRLLRSVMPKATNPNDPNHLAYSARALAIIDRQIRLDGLDAPTQVAISTPDAARVEAYISQVLALAGAQGAAEEADILDADVLEDEDG